jgi:hypothetical protein
MTDAELRLIKIFITSDASRPTNLPDWLLALIVGDRPDHPSHELNTAASPHVPRLRPAINFDAAWALIGATVSRPPLGARPNVSQEDMQRCPNILCARVAVPRCRLRTRKGGAPAA